MSLHCLFCNKKAEAGECLRKAATLELDFRVRKCAQQLQDEPLLAKLNAGDMVALDAEYHNKCLVSLDNRVRCTKSSTEPDEDEVNHGISFAELIIYIEEVHGDNLIAPIFYLSDLVNLYSKRLEQHGCNVTGSVHSTRLKNRILGYFPEMEATAKKIKLFSL